MMAFDIFTIRRLLLWTLYVWNPLSAVCRQIGQSAAGRWRWCPDYTENVTPRRRYLHCLLSIDTQDPGLKLLYDGHWTKTQRVKQAWAGLECVECLAFRLPGAVTMDTKIHWYAKQWQCHLSSPSLTLYRQPELQTKVHTKLVCN